MLVLIDEVQRMMPGTYVYSLQFTLPHDLPSSFESWIIKSLGKGVIIYTAKVEINNPQAKFTKFKKELILIKSLDLNECPSLQVNHLTFL